MPSQNTHTFKALHNHRQRNRKGELKKSIKSISDKIEKLKRDLFDLNISYQMPYREKRLKRLTIIEEIDKLEMKRNKQKETLRLSSATIGGGKSKKTKKTKKTRKNRTRKEKLTFMGFISNLM